jgi:ApaG protein
MGASEMVTNGIQVQAHSYYVPRRSAPARDLYYFGYKIRITNVGDERVKLISRHWVITDGDGHVEEVRGGGVVGETPTLDPGETFEYESACPLRTPMGAMRGEYTFTRDDGEHFEAEIGDFSMELPHSLH